MEILLLTNCSFTKSAPAEVRAAMLRASSVDDVARQWTRLIKRASDGVVAQELYTGPSASVAKQIVKKYRSSWYVVSAGLGLVRSSSRVPPYDLTIGGNRSSNVLRKIKPAGARTAEGWWNALAGARGALHPVADLVRRRRHSRVLIALSAPYLKMIGSDLSSLNAADIKRIRIFTTSTTVLPKELQVAAMPYDQRLNAKNSAAPGPMASFAQRAAKHFLGVVHPLGSADADAAQVTSALKKSRRPVRKHRKRMSDDELLAIARKLRSTGISSAYAALRQLRQRLRVACEQSRFVRIWAGASRR